MIALVTGVLAASVLMLVIKIRLTQTLDQVLSRQLLSTEYVTVNSEIKQLNGSIARIETLQKLFTPSSVLLRDVAQRTPEGVYVTGLDFEVRTEAMRLSGIAATREDLLAFEKAVRESPFIKTLESPISNLFQKRDINFQFKILLNVGALRNAVEPAL
jgi:Tfp pilus assembly protein PilN